MLRPLAYTSLGLALVAGLFASHAQAADDDRPLESIELELGSRTYTAEYLRRDTDGDGWSDWYERLEGTDPKDPASHPDSIHLDIVDTTVFVQSIAFPDRLVALDGLALPERTDSVAGLMDLVSQITGSTSLGKFNEQMKESLAGLGGDDELAAILGDVSSMHTSVDISMGSRTNGQLTALISAEGSGINVSFSKDGVRIVTTTSNLDSTNTGIVITHESLNGSPVSVTKTDYKNGVLVYTTTTDANGSVVAEAVVPLSAATTVAPETTTKPANSTPDTTTAATTATTVKGDYVNPDADTVTVPTPAEAAARLAFLSGVRARYAKVLDLPTEINPDKPGVIDPAEPGCDDERCVAFTVVTAPDLNRTSGGCPPTYCNAAPPIKP